MDLVEYKRTATFDAASIPEGLLREHRTGAGVWGRIVVESGQLRLTDATGVRVLGPGEVAVVEPEAPHAVAPVGEVRFHVAFCRPAARYVLRPATDDDFETIHRWRTEAYRTYVERHCGPWDDEEQRVHLREAWDRRRRHVLVVDGADAGTLDVYEEPGALVVGNVVLAPEHRGRGIGTAVLCVLLAEARARGLATRLKVFRDNPARRLYERLGFREDQPLEAQIWMVVPAPEPPG